MASTLCPAVCADVTLLPNDEPSCELNVRKRQISQIGFFPCSVDLPTPFSCASLQALVTANLLVFTSPLANVQIADPTYDSLQIADCLDAIEIPVERILSVEDRISIDIPATTTSPFVAPIPFYNYDFWADKMTKKVTLRTMIIYCDGTVVVPRDSAGNPMSMTLNAFLAYADQGTGATAYKIEIVKATMKYKGDPLFFIKPELTSLDVPFNIQDCSFI